MSATGLRTGTTPTRTRPAYSSPAPRDGGGGFSGRERERGRGQLRRFLADERGAVTAEYALVIMAAVAFAGLLIVIMRSEEVRAMLLSLVQNALGSAG